MANSDQKKFQSTLPREERRQEPTSTSSGSYFNPRSHERSDALRIHDRAHVSISIHAPTRGATASFPAILDQTIEFQSTLPREERQVRVSDSEGNAIFQSTLPREERLHGT